MTNFLVGLGVGAAAGATLGLVTLALMVAARRGDDQAERDEASRN